MALASHPVDPMYQNTPFDLSGRVVVVTGASGGLGNRFAATMAGAGAAVVATARDAANPALLALEQQLGREHLLRASLDVASPESIDALLEAVAAEFGPADILINNAGIATPSAAVDVDAAKWDGVIDTNLKGAWLVARAFGHALIEAKSTGSIVNVSSILSRRVAGGLMSYAVSKAGLEQMTRSLALEWARYGIRVNSLAPGYILTEMNRAHFASETGQKMIARIPQRRIGDPADLDGALLLLASDASAYMTGSSIVVDGGHLQSSL